MKPALLRAINNIQKLYGGGKIHIFQTEPDLRCYFVKRDGKMQMVICEMGRL